MIKQSQFRYFKTSPEIIRLAVMLYVRLPLLLRNVEALCYERGVDVSHETVRFWWNHFGPIVQPSNYASFFNRVSVTGGLIFRAWRARM